MILKYHLDTSVFGGYYDELQAFTKLLFEKIIDEKIRIIYSELTENE